MQYGHISIQEYDSTRLYFITNLKASVDLIVWLNPSIQHLTFGLHEKTYSPKHVGCLRYLKDKYENISWISICLYISYLIFLSEATEECNTKKERQDSGIKERILLEDKSRNVIDHTCKNDETDDNYFIFMNKSTFLYQHQERKRK